MTDLYTKAAEQLGHAKAAVRLAGLYSLERLAQDNPGHRQTIVNVICAYLRMPYTPPERPDLDQARRKALRDAARRYRAASRTTIGPAPASQESDAENERQVRLTAQRILADHLRGFQLPLSGKTTAPSERFWNGMRIDLTGALLIDLDFSHCRTAEAVFHRATFIGDAAFDGAIFTEVAEFDGAIFTEEVDFSHATFSQSAWFNGVTFSEYAWFGAATFTGKAWFDAATFTEDASFIEATFASYAGFNKATFTGEAKFDEAIFTGQARFDEATFKGIVDLSGARAVEVPDAQHVWPPGWVVAGGRHRRAGAGGLRAGRRRRARLMMGRGLSALTGDRRGLAELLLMLPRLSSATGTQTGAVISAL